MYIHQQTLRLLLLVSEPPLELSYLLGQFACLFSHTYYTYPVWQIAALLARDPARNAGTNGQVSYPPDSITQHSAHLEHWESDERLGLHIFAVCLEICEGKREYTYSI